jgi:hypothetical protein
MSEREEMTEQLLVNCREILAPRNAFLYRGTDFKYTSLTTDAEITRAWREGVADKLPQLCDFLDTFTDAKNETPKNFVTDPQAGGETFHGRWRQAFTRPFLLQDGTLALLQVLRRGYIETVMADGKFALWDEVRVEREIRSPSNSTHGSNQPMSYLVARIPNISPDKIHAIELEVETLSSSAWHPVIRGESYASDMYLLNKIVNIEDDGSATLTLFFGQTRYSLEGFANWLTARQETVVWHFNVPEEIAQTVIDAEKGKGKHATCTHNFDLKLVDIIIRTRNYVGEIYPGIRTAMRCDSYRITDFYLGVEGPDVYECPSTYASGVSYVKDARDNGDGSWDISISMLVTQYREYMTRFASVNTLIQGFERQQLGVTNQAIPDISSPPQGTAYQQTWRPNDDCSKDVITAYRKGLYVDEGMAQDLDSALLAEHAHRLHNVLGKIAVTPAEQGKIYRVRNDLNEFGLYEVEKGIAVSKPAAMAFRSEATPFRVEDSIIYVNATAGISAPTPLVGMYAVNQTIKQDGTYDQRLTYRIGTDTGEAAFAATRAELADVDAVVYRNRNSAIQAEDSVQGVVYDSTNSLNDDGTYDARRNARMSHPATVAFSSLSTMFRSGTTVGYRNTLTKVDAPAVSGTGIYRTQNDVNEDGTYNAQLVYEVGTNEGEAPFAASRAGLVDVDSVLYKNRNSAVEAEPSVQGVVYDSTNSLNDDGTYDARRNARMSKPATLAFASLSTVFKSGTTISYQNSATKVDAPVASGPGIYRVQDSINDDGTYNAQLTYEIGTDAGEASFAKVRSQLDEQDAVIYKSRSTAIDAPSDSQGIIYRADNALRDDGTYDAEQVAALSVADNFAFISERTAFRTGSNVAYRNSRSIITAPDVGAGGIYRVSQSENADGTYDAVLLYTAGNANGVAAFESLNSALSEEDSIIYNGVQAQVTAPASTQGMIYSVSNSLLDDGTYNARLVYQHNNAATAVNESMHSLLGDDSTTIYRNRMTSISSPAAVQGVIYVANQALDDAGLYQGQIVTRASNAVQAASIVGYGLSSYVAALVYRNSPTVIECPAVLAGTYSVNGLSINNDGTYDATLIYDGRLPFIGWDIGAKYRWWVYVPQGLIEGKFHYAEHYMYNSNSFPAIEDFFNDGTECNLQGTTWRYEGGNKWSGLRIRRSTGMYDMV